MRFVSALCLWSFVLPVVAAPTGLSPSGGETVELLTSSQRGYLYDHDHVWRDTNVRNAPNYSGGTAVTLSWSGAGGAVTVNVKRLSDSKVVHAETTSGSSIAVYNLEIGAGYELTVTDSSGASASTTFYTSPDAPRLLKAGSMKVLRDLGGWTGFNGCKVRQNELLRGGPASGIDNDAAAKTFLRDILGLRTELDLRGESSDKLNVDGVTYVPLSRDEQYRVLTTTVNGRSGMSEEKWNNLIRSFEYIFDKSKRPLYFHCSAGKDRTGVTAALVLALLGVDIEDIWRDYQATPQSSPIIDNDSYFQGYLHDMATVMTGHDTFQEQVEAYFIEKLGFTTAQIETFRREMLIGYGEPECWTEEPHFVTATRTKLSAGKVTEEQYEGFETTRGFWYTWGKDGAEPTGWTQADGTPLKLAKPAGAGWKLMVKKGAGK